MKKGIKLILEFVVVLGAIGLFTHLYQATAAYLPLPDEATQVYQGEGQLPTPLVDNDGTAVGGLQMVQTLVFNALKYFKVIFAILAILFITVIGFRMVISGEEEETVTKMRKSLIYAIIGLVLVSMSQEIGKLFDMEDSSLLEGPQEILKRVQIFDRQVEILITFVKYVIGSFAVIMIIKTAIAMIAGGGEEEQVSKNRKALMYSAGGLLVIYIGDIFINKVFYKIDKTSYDRLTGVHPTLDPYEGVSQLVGITNFIVSFVGPVAIIVLIIAGIMYATSAGEDEKMEKARRLLTAAVIAILIIYGAFAIVSTVITGKLSTAAV